MNFFSSDRLVSEDATQTKNLTAQKAEKSQPERRYKRGYDTRHLPRNIRIALRDAESSDLWARVREAILTVASIPSIAVATIVLVLTIFNSNLPRAAQAGLAILAYLVACTFIARQLRGLEIMVHDASHLTWTRKNPKLNNLLADIYSSARRSSALLRPIGSPTQSTTATTGPTRTHAASDLRKWDWARLIYLPIGKSPKRWCAGCRVTTPLIIEKSAANR